MPSLLKDPRSRLLPEVFLQLLQNCSTSTIARASSVSRDWRKEIQAFPTLFQKVSLKSFPGGDIQDGLDVLRSYNQLSQNRLKEVYLKFDASPRDGTRNQVQNFEQVTSILGPSKMTLEILDFDFYFGSFLGFGCFFDASKIFTFAMRCPSLRSFALFTFPTARPWTLDPETIKKNPTPHLTSFSIGKGMCPLVLDSTAAKWISRCKTLKFDFSLALHKSIIRLLFDFLRRLQGLESPLETLNIRLPSLYYDEEWEPSELLFPKLTFLEAYNLPSEFIDSIQSSSMTELSLRNTPIVGLRFKRQVKLLHYHLLESDDVDEDLRTYGSNHALFDIPSLCRTGWSKLREFKWIGDDFGPNSAIVILLETLSPFNSIEEQARRPLLPTLKSITISDTCKISSETISLVLALERFLEYRVKCGKKIERLKLLGLDISSDDRDDLAQWVDELDLVRVNST